MLGPRVRSALALSVALPFLVILSACMSGNGGGGGGGGQGKVTVGLGFAPGGSTTPTLVAGSTGTLTFIVDNIGGLASSGAITVSFPLTFNGNSTGVTFSSNGSGGTGWDCSGSTSTNVNCTTQAVVAPSASAPTLTVALNVAANASSFSTNPTITNTSNSADGQQTFILNVTVVLPPNVTIQKKHVGSDFVAGNTGQYAFTVSNTGNGAGNNVKVTDTLPTGLTYMSYTNGATSTGSGGLWACSAAGQAVTCTLASALNALTEATALTLTVTVASNANVTITNTAAITATNDTGTTGKSSTDIVSVVLPTGSVSLSITEPTGTSVTLGTNGTLNLIAVLQNFTTNQINWSVDGVQGGNAADGTITSTTMSGGAAIYTAPSSLPGTNNNVVTVAATAQDNPLATTSINITLVLNQNAALTGQFAFTMYGFQPSSLPFAAVGTFKANGDAAGTMSNIFIDTNVGATSTTSMFTSKSQWNGTYNMDSATHGIMHLSSQSNSAITVNISLVLNAAGTFGYFAENDSPAGNVGNGEFSKQDTSAFDTASGHISGSWIFRHGHGRLGQVTFAASTSTTATVNGQEDDSSGGHDVVSSGTLTLDSDGTGHGVITFPLVSASTTITESVYILGGATDDGMMYMINQGTGSGNTPTGLLAYQSTSSGYTAATAFPTNTVTAFAMLGENSAGHSSVYIGQLEPNTVLGDFNMGVDYNDGGIVQDAGNLTSGGVATSSMDAAGTGRGTMTMSVPSVNGTFQIPLVFYLRAPNAGFVMEYTSTGSENRAGVLRLQTTSVLNLANPTIALAGVNLTTPATVNGVSDFLMTAATSSGRGSITNGLEDISQVGGPAQFGVPFTASYVLGGGIDGPGVGNIGITTSATIFGSNEVFLVAANNGTVFGVPFYTGNAAQILDPPLMIISINP